MSSSRPTIHWNKRDIDRMLDLLPTLESPGFRIAEWPDRTIQQHNGSTVYYLPLPEYHPIIDQFYKLCENTSCYIKPYNALPEDPEGQESDSSVYQLYQSVADIVQASLNQIRRYFILCARGERFCDGCIAGQYKDGLLLAAFHRLKELREKMNTNSGTVRNL